MAGALISVALVAALAAVAVRALRGRAARSSRERAIAQRPGFSAGSAIKIATFSDIDDAVDTLRCPCGGLLDRIGEASRPNLRVVRCTCVVCEEDVDLFFDLSELRN